MHDLTGLAAVGLSLMIPIVAIIAVAFRKARVSEMLHRERMLAMEKGLPAPSAEDYALAAQKAPHSPKTNLLRGLLWGFVGLGLIVAFRLQAFGLHEETGPFLAAGIICLCVGVAYSIFYFVESRTSSRPQS